MSAPLSSVDDVAQTIVMRSSGWTQEGFTLIELLIATAMTIVVVGAAVTMLISVMHRQPQTTRTADQIGNARNAIEKITVDLRQGVKLTEAEPFAVEMSTFCGKTEGTEPCVVRYDCAQETGKATYGCSREVVGGGTTWVLEGLASPEVFCFYPFSEEVGPSGNGSGCGVAVSPVETTYVGIKVQLPQENNATTNTVFEGGAALHNAPGVLEGG